MFNPLTAVKNAQGQVKGQVAGQAAAFRQDHADDLPFAPLRQNNQVTCFSNGEQYFKAVYAAMKGAKESIFITGWQVNWDVELVPGERLIDVLHERVQSSENFRVFVMPWMSPKVGVNTGDLETMLAVFQLNAGRKTMQAMCCPAAPQNDHLGVEGVFFSHHQKMVVVDNKLAFVGGIDLAYGRLDDDKFSLNHTLKKFNEKYNPGVPPTQAMRPEDGQCLSSMDLLIATLGASRWNSGSNSSESGLAQLLKHALTRTDELALRAVELANKAATQAAKQTRQVVSQQAAALKAGANKTADVVVAAGHAVSQQCAALQIPDLYGGVQAYKVGAQPTSPIPGQLQKLEAGARDGWNSTVDSAAQLADFLAPVKRLRVHPEPQSGLPQAIARGEQFGRKTVNIAVDAASDVAGGVQQTAVQARTVCVEIGPSVQQGVADAKTAVRQTQAAAQQAGREVAQAAAHTVNVFQKAIIEQLTELRAEINEQVLGLVAMGDDALDKLLKDDRVTPARVQGVIEQLKRLLKLIYLSQLAVNWAHVSQHHLLLNKTVKAAPGGGQYLGKTQPRQPWQDVHAQIAGPSVYDLAMNFIGRWNATQESYLSDTTLGDAGKAVTEAVAAVVGGTLLTKGASVAGDAIGRAIAPKVRSSAMIQGSLLPTEPARPVGPPTGVAVRVLRSASVKLQKQEAAALGSGANPKAVQCEIETQMVNVIGNASDFIYIENQFFQSGFGTPSIDAFSERGAQQMSGPIQYLMSQRGNRITAQLTTLGSAQGAKLMPKNKVCSALASRIEQAIRRDDPFHVYMVLPVHPEGKLSDVTIIGQIHWTMQSLVFADHSLVNRIRRAIVAKELCKQPLNQAQWDQAMARSGDDATGRPLYKDVETDRWSKYLTLLNLRTCEKVGGVVRTEQIYIHSKLLIADDRHVILGSANINDRSLDGGRDSELAVLLMDTARESTPLREKSTWINPLARKLRMDLWQKHLAFAGGNGIVQSAASAMESLIKRPAADETIQELQSLASDNAAAYRKEFPFIPWSEDNSKGASIWPACPVKATAEQAALAARTMPFDERFWLSPGTPSAGPTGIKGHFTQLPINWTQGENNHPNRMSVMVLSHRGDQPTNHGTTHPSDSAMPVA